MTGAAGLPWVWGATTEEAARSYPADHAVPGTVVTMTRAIDVAAAQRVTWRWLCQLAVAPYSYDLVDNLGRRSPQTLTPGADQLETGQVMAVVLRLTSHEAPHQWTGRTTPRGDRLFGPVAMTYAAEPVAAPSDGAASDGASSRIVCRLAVPGSTGVQRARAAALAWGDLVMMRRQLLNLKALAERSTR